MADTDSQNRTIFCRDNLNILRGINLGNIRSICLDLPFNKKKEWLKKEAVNLEKITE